MSVSIKTKDQLAIMKMGGRLLASVLDHLAATVAPGVTLRSLNQLAEGDIIAGGGTPSFLGYQPEGASSPYPASICASVNECVVHGLPDDYRLENGDLITLDLGVKFKGLHTDSARTFIVGRGSKESYRLLAVTETALYQGIRQAVAGRTLGDLGHAISAYARRHKITVIRGLTGHGIGRELHEEPTVFNFGRPGEGLVLAPGMTIAIEPMFSLGRGEITQNKDGSYRTADHSLSAHFEHTVAITDAEPLILTASPSSH